MLLSLGLGATLVMAAFTEADATEPQSEVDATPPKNTGLNAGSNVNIDRFLYAAGMYAATFGQNELLAAIFFPPPQQSLLPGEGPGSGRRFARSRDTGLAGGEHDGVRRINIWASGAYSNYEDTLSSTSMDGETWNGTGGVDYMFYDWFIAGLSLGYEDSNSDTNYNRGHVDTDGITVSPYFLFLLNQYVSVDGALGYSDIDIDQDRTLPGTATVVTGSLDAERFFGSAGISAGFWRGNWNFSGRLGFFYTTQQNDPFVESDGTVNPELDSDLGQAQLGGRVAYYAGIAMPYVSVDFNYDTTHDITAVGVGQAAPSGDRSDFVLGTGVDFFVNDMISAGVRADTVQGRANFDSYSASGNVSFRF